jgi:hypothetical protein
MVKKTLEDCATNACGHLTDCRVHISNGTYTPTDCQVSIDEDGPEFTIKK